MTADHTHPEPIRIAVVKYDDSCKVVEITPDIARQIVAMAGALLMPPPVEVPPGQRSRNPILDNSTKPAAPDTDEAAVEAILSVCRSLTIDYDDPDLAVAILDAIRNGEVPLPDDAPQIAALRAKLARAEERDRSMQQVVTLADDNRHAIRADRDRLAAQVESLTRERDAYRASCDKLAGLLRAARGHNCDHLHHEKKDQHDSMTPCPILSRIDAALAEAVEAGSASTELLGADHQTERKP